MLLELAILKNFDAGTYKAGVQLAGSLTAYFDDVPVSRAIPTSALVTGNRVILAIPGDNPKDACVMASWPGGSPAGGGGMEVHGNEYHDPDFAEAYHTHSQLHDGQHAITSAPDHTSSATGGKMLKADANGLPVNATNTDTEVSDAVNKKHTQLCEAADFTKLDAIEAGADVTANHAPQAHKTSHHDGGSDEMSLAGLDGEPSTLTTHKNATTGVHGVGAGTIAKVADIATDSNLSSAAQDAISKKHTQNTDKIIKDADGDTQIQVEESADEDKIRLDVKGVEAFLLDDAGVLTLAKQSGCRAYLSANQLIASGAWTKVNINALTYDVQTEFNTSTYKFTAKTAGTYLVIHQVALFKATYLASGTACVAGIRKNGAQVAESDLVLGGAFNPCWQCTALLQLAVNDYIEGYIYHNDGSGGIYAWGTYDVLFVAKLA
jgi:hypothetical protein